MKSVIILAIAAFVLTSCSSSSPTPMPSDSASVLQGEDGASKELPAFSWSTPASYKVDHFMASAEMLQSLGKDKAVKLLHSAIIDRKASDETVIFLCRMLFTAKPGGEFRRPALGDAVVVGGRDNFPLEPIELVAGIPFLVVTGYNLANVPEPAETYLNYCLSECDWGTFQYKAKTMSEKTTALEKLHWKTPLSASEMGFVATQIEGPETPRPIEH